MPHIGYALSSEEHLPNDLVRLAAQAEEAGFGYALISDHYHPWVDAQGESPFVWSVIGGDRRGDEAAAARDGRHLPDDPDPPGDRRPGGGDGRGDDARPLLPRRRHRREPERAHPRHHWPAPDERLEMLEEAVEVIRPLWKGGYQTHRGKYYTVENARLYTLPDEPPGSTWRPPSRRRPSSPGASATHRHRRARRGDRRAVRGRGRRRKAQLRPGSRLLGEDGAGSAARPRTVLAERGPPGASRRSFRSRSISSKPRRW